LELIKPSLQDAAHPDGPVTRQTLVETMEITMRLLHPFMPFITEEIWQTIPHQGDSIVIQAYPTQNTAWHAPEAEHLFTLLEQTISLVRTGRVLLNYAPGQHIAFSAAHEDPNKHRQLHDLQRHLAHLGRGAADVAPSSAWTTRKLLRLVTEGLTFGLVVSGDVDLKKALDRIVKQQDEQEKEIGRLSGKLGNQEFVAKAPPEVIADHQTRLQSLRNDQVMLASSEQQLRAMLGT
jgi:valyl-tRNA synthetase